MTKNNAFPRPPQHLSKEAKAMWKALLVEWRLDEVGSLAILAVGLESFDRCQMARQVLAKDGLTFLDKFGQLKPHPLLACVRDAEAGFRSALRQLGVDKSPDAPPSPRPGRPGNGIS